MNKRTCIIMCCAALLTFCVQAQQSNTVASINTQQVDSSIKVSVVDKLIKVSNAPQNSKMEIYNIVGSKVHEIEMKHASGEYLLSLPKGYYIVRIEGIVRKIVIR